MVNYAYYIFIIIAFIVAVIVFKKVAGCLMKSLFFAIIIAVLTALYFMYFK